MAPNRPLPDFARAVVVGAGIVGSCIVNYLANAGWRQIVMVDKGQPPTPGGTTEHSSAMVFLPEATGEFTDATKESTRKYQELGCYIACGGIEVARRRERLDEFKRRLSLAHSWGFDAELITAREVVSRVPYVAEAVIRGGFYTPGTGVVDAVRAAMLMRQQAEDIGAVSIHPLTRIEALEIREGRITGVKTSGGTIRTGTVIVCAGVWSPLIGRMAGVPIPISPAVHQLVTVGPIAAFAALKGEINFPIIRDMDAKMYERQRGGDMEIGSTAYRPILVDPTEIPELDEVPIAPAEFPFTKSDFDVPSERALELMPTILGDKRAGIRNAINGLVSLSPDGLPVIGESRAVRGFWSADRIDVKIAPGMARILVDWMERGEPDLSCQPFDIARFQGFQRTATHVRSRAAESFSKNYDIVHPAEEWRSNREVRLSPMHPRHVGLGAVFTQAGGWEVPNWYQGNEALVAEFDGQVMPRPNEWDGRFWSPIVNAEHLAMRERVGITDATALSVFEVRGRGACAFLQRVAVDEMDFASGRSIYTVLLDSSGLVISDVTVMRLGRDYYLVMTGGHRGPRDLSWLSDHVSADASVDLCDVSSALCAVAVWGPRSRQVLQRIASIDLSNESFPFAAARHADIGTVPTVMSRRSYVGELGWEIFAPMEQGLKLWDEIWQAGAHHGIVALGAGVSWTGRLEKSYRAHGFELGLDYGLKEAGLARKHIKAADFIGKASLINQLNEPQAAILCSLQVEDHTSSTGEERYMLGLEPILGHDHKVLVDGNGRRSYVTSAGSAPSLGKHLLMAYLPQQEAILGARLYVEYFDEEYPVTVVAVGYKSLFDPESSRLRG